MHLINQEKSSYSVAFLCRLLNVSSSSYYRRNNVGDTSMRKQRDQQLKEKIIESWQASRGNYGSARILKDLRKKGIRTSRKRISRLMKQEGIQGRYNQPKRPKTTDSRHSKKISENLLKPRNFPTQPREVIVTDTTYIWTNCGWHYLATVMDLFTREILGWAFSGKNDRHLICNALWAVGDKLNATDAIIHHSDRGSTYCSDEYRKLMDKMNLLSSMSAKGYCYDNAHMESFFGSLKCECQALDQSLYPEQARMELFDYIEGFYNTHRIHTALGDMSPKQFFNHTQAKTPMGVLEG
jgi:putative transposase